MKEKTDKDENMEELPSIKSLQNRITRTDNEGKNWPFNNNSS